MHYHQPSATAKTHMIPLHFPHGHPRGRTPLHTLCGIILDTESQVDGPADCEWCLEIAQDIASAMVPI